jgi:IS30 family transposase
MTYDQGSEMALHETLSAQLKMDIFFCDPHRAVSRLKRDAEDEVRCE